MASLIAPAFTLVAILAAGSVAHSLHRAWRWLLPTLHELESLDHA